MVSTAAEFNFIRILDDFFSLKKLTGPHSAMLRATVNARAAELFSHPDIRYMPVFKILDMLAAFVNIAAAIAAAPQLRAPEAKALIRESLADTTPLIHQFMLDAALERVRYEPMMLPATPTNPATARLQRLQHRWAAMRAAHQEKSPLPAHWLEAIDTAVDTALTAPEFAAYRQGPMLQLFSEMLALGRKLAGTQAAIETLTHGLSRKGALWKRYALKSARYREAPAPDFTTAPFPAIPSSRWLH